MRTDGKLRKWLFWLLAVAIASQFYVFQELVVALSFFAIGFCALTIAVLSLWLLHKGWKIAVVRILDGERWIAGRLYASTGWARLASVKVSARVEERKTGT